MRRRKQSALHARWTGPKLKQTCLRESIANIIIFECAMIYTCDSNNVDRVSKHIEATFSTIQIALLRGWRSGDGNPVRQ